ncbi:Arm DNA-binding domain-containing protein [Mediterraneibacter faecis]|uniref:Arm DNA-binding domain-containing protein n=1 Tax=Mediterraneibacter faecis TaxID=592978 RepID=UPI003D08F3B3
MTVIKNQKSNTYEVRTYYKDWTGVRKQKTKRGFKRKCDAQEWERAFKLKENLSLDMYFGDFVDIYLNDIKARIKYNTWLTKKHIVEKKILPYFSKKKLQEIKPSDIRQWQNTMMNYRNKQGEGYSQVYLKTIHNQLSAIFNHAVNFYDLKSNAARKAGSMGKERTKEMLFWTKEEYMKFIEAVADKPISFYAFEILYWCGLRMGDDDDKIRLNQRKPSKYKGLSRFGPEKNLQRINKFMKERPTFYKKLIQMKENFRFYLRCFYCITKVVILQFNSEKQDRISS